MLLLALLLNVLLVPCSVFAKEQSWKEALISANPYGLFSQDTVEFPYPEGNELENVLKREYVKELEQNKEATKESLINKLFKQEDKMDNWLRENKIIPGQVITKENILKVFKALETYANNPADIIINLNDKEKEEKKDQNLNEASQKEEDRNSIKTSQKGEGQNSKKDKMITTKYIGNAHKQPKSNTKTWICLFLALLVVSLGVFLGFHLLNISRNQVKPEDPNKVV
jgi:hypothetical protein